MVRGGKEVVRGEVTGGGGEERDGGVGERREKVVRGGDRREGVVRGGREGR